jgi:response regulator of citrate/malate metabolism
VELEKDLSLKQQLLDVVIIEKKDGKAPEPLPDGLENLAAHNLMTYKSHQETLDGWTIEELCGHYVYFTRSTLRHFQRFEICDSTSL